jgi:hypothetical protein
MSATATPADPPIERLADILLALEKQPAFKLTPLAITRLTGPEAHLIVGFPDGSRLSLTPHEAELAAFFLRIDPPHPDSRDVAKRLDAGAHCAELALFHLQNGRPSGRIEGFAA